MWYTLGNNTHHWILETEQAHRIVDMTSRFHQQQPKQHEFPNTGQGKH